MARMGGYADIHTHLLPGIDDGAPDQRESLAMARVAAQAGTELMAATPHLHPDHPAVSVDALAEHCQALREELQRQAIPLQVVSGAEVSVLWAIDAGERELALASYAQRGSDLLLEAPFGQAAGLARFSAELIDRGYRVTLAHPERCAQFQRDPAPLRELLDQGVLLQLNADSLLDGGAAGRLARALLTQGEAHALASDGHRARAWRPVSRLAEAVAVAAGLIGAERARWMADDVPRAILAGAELPAPPALTPPPRRKRAARWLRGAGRPG